MTEDERIKAARSAYYREYRKKNRQRIKEINRRYWLKKADKELGSERGEPGAEDKTDS